MDKKTLTKEMMESGKTFAELGFEFSGPLTWEEIETCAMDLAGKTVIPDSDGVVYWSYRKGFEMIWAKVKYFTTIDTSDWETEEGREAIVNFAIRSKIAENDDIYWENGWGLVNEALYTLFEAMKAKHEKTSSLPYKIGKTFESVLGDEDIIKNIAQSREVSEKMIDMMAVFNDKKADDKKAAVLNMFAKK